MNNRDPYFQFPWSDIDRVCGYLRTLMALEEITDWQATKEAAKAASLTTDGQITNIKSLINQHIGKLVRHLADLHRLKPNRAAFDVSKKACEGIKTW